TQAGVPPAVVNLTTLNTGGGTDTVYVKGTAGPLVVNGGGPLAATIGSLGRTQDVHGNVTINDPPAGAYAPVIVDDHNAGAARTYTLGQATLGGAPYGTVAGQEGGATIAYKYADTSSAVVWSGGGTDVVNVLATGLLGGSPANRTTVQGSSENLTVNV